MEPDRIERLEKIHFRGIRLGDLPAEQRHAQLAKRVRSRYVQLVVNVLAILLFAYSWVFNITHLEGVFIVILGVVFTLNIGIIALQLRQLAELKDHFQTGS